MIWDNTTLLIDDSVEDRTFREEVRAFIADHYPADLRHRTKRVTPPELRPWHRSLFERGWIAPDWPREAGGMGATLTQQIVLVEEMLRVGAEPPMPHGLSFIGPVILRAGTAAQKERFLPRILSGEDIWCQGYSEAASGSDLASLKTRAELVGDAFIVNGHKMWTTNGQHADWMFALVRTDQNAKPQHAGISMLLIDLKSAGVTVRPIQTIKGDAEFAEEFFEDVRVPKQNLIGPLNGGWQLATSLLGAERFNTSNPSPTGRILNKVRQVIAHSGATGNSYLLTRLAELEVDLLAFTAFYRQSAALHAAKRVPVSMPQLIKIVGGELWLRAAELLQQAGGMLATAEHDLTFAGDVLNIPAVAMEARRMTVGSGTVEVARNVIAHRVLGLPR